MDIKTNNNLKTVMSLVVVGLIITTLAIVLVFAGNGTGHNGKIDTEQTASQAIVFATPVLNAEIIKGYSATELQYSATMKQWEAHKAIDFGTLDQADVYCAFDGTIESISNPYLMGTTIVINHGNNLKTVYSSLDIEGVDVNEGDKVKKGEVIGKTSKSAQSESADGNHLHFEVLLDNKKVDPNQYLNLENK